MKLEFRSFVGEHDWGWVQQQVPILRIEDTCGLMAIDTEKNETVGACIIDNWTENSAQVHLMMTSPMVIRHGFINFVAHFLYRECQLKYLYGLVPADKTKAVALNTRMGFKEVARLPDAWCDGVDYLIMSMTPADCIFYGDNEKVFTHGKKVEQAA